MSGSEIRRNNRIFNAAVVIVIILFLIVGYRGCKHLAMENMGRQMDLYYEIHKNDSQESTSDDCGCDD